jgi:hypothetical protein
MALFVESKNPDLSRELAARKEMLYYKIKLEDDLVAKKNTKNKTHDVNIINLKL